ncbi:MAG: exosortase/archaeosortase family protein [Verrucomicrobia bacterium]|nr:exosortase/archaeosortase family protein [Verrucomicrobiota bacterium]
MSRSTTFVPGENTPHGLARRWSAWSLVPFGAVMVYFIFLMPYAAGYADFRYTIAQWLKLQWSQPTWQHGALAPCIAAFLVWRQRRSLSTLKPESNFIGLVLIIFSLLMFWVGYRGNIYYAGFVALQLLVAGVVLWLWGWEYFKFVSFAWFILGFAWPYVFLEDTLAFQLRYFMVSATSWLLNLAGIATLQDGTSLVSAATALRGQGALFNLGVDGPCSGMRSLFALMMVSALYGYFRQRSFWRRSLIFVLSLPLAVLANMVRILILIVASIFFGQDFAVGRGEEYTSNFHLLAGIAVFLVGLLGLKAIEAVLNRRFGNERPLPLFES